MGEFLKWLSDPDKDAFVVATANDISAIPGEYKREGRFDAIFMVDLPNREEKDVIWNIWKKHYGIVSAENPRDTNWAGNEIESCCRKAKMLGIPLAESAEKYTSVQHKEQTALTRLERLRTEVSGFALHASKAAETKNESGRILLDESC